MKSYRVTWAIDIDADSPREAAERAAAYQRDPDSAVHVFDVYLDGSSEGVRVDLDDDAENHDTTELRVVCHYGPGGPDAWYCAQHLPAGARPEHDEVTAYVEGISDDGFTGYPKCASCGRVHDWVNLATSEDPS